MTKAYLYARYSPRHDEKANGDTILAQFASMQSYCLDRGYAVAGQFSDEEVSGGGRGTELDPADELVQRDGLWQAIQSLRKGDVLVVYKRDRLARSIYASEYLRRLVTTRGATIESLQGLNGSTP